MSTKSKVRISTVDPGGLLDQIKTKIQRGEIDTWVFDEEGDLTHSPEQWRKQAFLRPKIEEGYLLFEIIWPSGSRKEPAVNGVYLGRSIEMLVTHFSDAFLRASAV